ncbi:MAG: OsmC family protein [Alphaproteobacteria bacterium]|nr:OsmC family protein [Alphaproteobacteria bacterium]RZV98798.1 MAG: OsmC family peroxiredoxin [Paracoccaceae bacterium]
MTDQDIKTFDVIFECDARAVGKMRCEMDVSLVHPEKLSWEMASDEYGFHGGDGTAPLPIAYFMAGLTSCLMTQFRAFAKRLRVDIRDVSIHCRCEWQATQRGREPYESAPKSINMDLTVDSDASFEDVKRVIDAAKKGCFIEQMMNQQNDIGHRLKVGDEWVAV